MKLIIFLREKCFCLKGKLYKLLKAGKTLDDDLVNLYDYVEVLSAYLLVEDDLPLEEWQEKTIELISFAERNGLKAVAVSETYTYMKGAEFIEE